MRNKFLLTFVGVLLGGIAVGLAVGFALLPYFKPPVAPTVTPSDQIPPTSQPNPNPQQTPPTSTASAWEIQWKSPEKLSKADAEQLIFANTKTQADKGVLQPWFNASTTVYRVGFIDSGPYKGAALYVWRRAWTENDGPNFGSDGGDDYFYYRLMSDNGKTYHFIPSDVPLDDQREWMSDEMHLLLPTPSAYTVKSVPAFEAPTTVTLTNGKRISSGRRYTLDYAFSNPDPRLTPVTKTTDGDTVYRIKDEGCLALIAPDRRVLRYESKMTQPLDRSVVIAWKPGYEAIKGANTGEQGGCGALLGCTEISALSVADMIEAGTTAEGDSIFVAANPSASQEMKEVYQQWMVDGAKPSFATFAKLHPNAVFYWKDAIGRLVAYRSFEYRPQAECGKPVIYLYPTSTTSVSVALPSWITVTVSEPIYQNGWSVVADPNGTLHMASSTYGSLYWEGTGASYAMPKEGFIVKNGKVAAFFDQVLPKYGLNANEIKEFEDFWVPQLTGAPYFRISFLTDTWNRAVPLSVMPKPQTTIRLFMDWSPLSAPVSISKPKIVTPMRQGYTLVEWGGLLYKK